MKWEKLINEGKEEWKLKNDSDEYINGWQSIEGYWYYLDKNTNIMKTGWFEDSDGRWYYLREFRQGDFPIGSMVDGWFEENDKWYYLSNDWKNIDGKEYKHGEMWTGWLQTSNGEWYYFAPEHKWYGHDEYSKGQMVKGWVKSNIGKWYYFSPYNSNGFKEGQMLFNTTKNIDEINYKFDCNGDYEISNDLISNECVDFIGGWEGFYSHAYPDPYYGPKVKKYWTIGYGTCYCSIPSAFPNGLDSTCTLDQARDWLRQEAKGCYGRIETALKKYKCELNQHQFDALLSFAYNCGTDGLFTSTLFAYIVNDGRDASSIEKYFLMWNKANGKTSEGLTKRRKAEANLFNHGIYDASH